MPRKPLLSSLLQNSLTFDLRGSPSPTADAKRCVTGRSVEILCALRITWWQILGSPGVCFFQRQTESKFSLRCFRVFIHFLRLKSKNSIAGTVLYTLHSYILNRKCHAFCEARAVRWEQEREKMKTRGRKKRRRSSFCLVGWLVGLIGWCEAVAILLQRSSSRLLARVVVVKYIHRLNC